MDIKRYILHSIPDYLLCIALTAGISINVFHGFLLPEAMSGDLLRILVVTALLLIPLFCGAYNRRTALIAVIAGVVLVVGVFIGIKVSGISLLESPDAEQNGPLWYFLCVLCVLGVFLLSRTVTGSGVLVVGGVLLLCLLAFLEYTFYLWGLIVLLWAGGTMFFYKRYRRAVLTTYTSRTAFGPLLGLGSLICALCIALSSLIWYRIIAPMNPPSQEMKLVTELVSLDVVERLGVSKTSSVLDMDNASNEINENDQRLSDNMEGDEENQTTEEEQNSGEEQNSDGEQTPDGGETEENTEESYAISYQLPENTPVILIVIVLCLLILAVLFILLRRRIWLRRVQKFSRDSQVRYFYTWFLKKFPVLGLSSPEALTPYEYAAQIAGRSKFLAADSVTWEDLTSTFVCLCYGGQPVSEERYTEFVVFYKAFHKNCRHILGGRYVYKYFWL